MMLQATVRGAPSRISRALASALAPQVAQLEAAGHAAHPAMKTAARRLRESVARLAEDAPRGSDVQVQVTADRDPLGGCSTTVYVAITPRPEPGR